MAIRDFQESPFDSFVTRRSLVSRRAGSPFGPKWTRKRHSWAELVDLAFDAAGGFLKPLQVRAEIEHTMSEVEKIKPRAILEIGTPRWNISNCSHEKRRGNDHGSVRPLGDNNFAREVSTL